MQYEEYQLLDLVKAGHSAGEELAVKHILSGQIMKLILPLHVLNRDGYSWNCINYRWSEGFVVLAGLTVKRDGGWYVPEGLNLRLVIQQSIIPSTELGSAGYIVEYVSNDKVATEYEIRKCKEFMHTMDNPKRVK